MNRKELYSFNVAHNKNQFRIIIYKPNLSDIEDSSFFYGQKYNDYIRKGFLTRAMMAKQYGTIGSESEMEKIQNSIQDYYEAEKVVSLFETSKPETLSEEQKNRLEKAKTKYFELQTVLTEYQTNVRNQLSQTADVLAEERLFEWFLLFFSYYEEEFNGKRQIFPLFGNGDFDERRAKYIQYIDEENIPEEDEDKKKNALVGKSFDTLVKVFALWQMNNKITNKEIKDSLRGAKKAEKDVA